MGRCECPDPNLNPNGCNCALQVGPSGLLSLDGTGQPTDPYILDMSGTVSRGLLGRRVYNSAGTDSFVLADFPGAAWLDITCVGGGGGGAGAYAATGASVPRAGGAGGNMARSWVAAGSLGPVSTITVGAGGAGSVGSSAGNPGTDGGTSSFEAVVVAGGGPGAQIYELPGTGPITERGTPASPFGTGNILVLGAPGGPGLQFDHGFGIGGSGGASGSAYGFGNEGGIMFGFFGNPGKAGTGYGAGGSGAVTMGEIGFTGGNGTSGLVIVDVWG